MKKLRTVGCFIEYDGKFLILHRDASAPQGNTWGLPAGKVDPGETDVEAVIREIWEETGFRPAPSQLELLDNYEYHFPDLELTFPTFCIKLQQPLAIQHNPREHQTFKWVTGEECYAMPDLIEGFHDLLVWAGYVKK